MATLSIRSLPSYLDTHVHPGIEIPAKGLELSLSALVGSGKHSVSRRLTGRDVVHIHDGEFEFGHLQDADRHATASKIAGQFIKKEGFEIEKWPDRKIEQFLLLIMQGFIGPRVRSYRENFNYVSKRKVGLEDIATFRKYLQRNDPKSLPAFERYVAEENERFVQELSESDSENLIADSKVLSPATKELLSRYFYFSPTPAGIPKKMNAFFHELRKKIQSGENPIEIAAFVHMKIVEIHPFDDGNGRLARFFMNLILKKFGHPPIYFYSEKEYLKAVEEGLKPFALLISRKIHYFKKLVQFAKENFESAKSQNDYIAQAGIATCTWVLDPSAVEWIQKNKEDQSI
ncbi:MAG: Fic family protein [Parachlamydiales bacterium]|nr:Fic family protein [Parachlamydiales bacterium]